MMPGYAAKVPWAQSAQVAPPVPAAQAAAAHVELLEMKNAWQGN
jgi:hypothetical protein